MAVLVEVWETAADATRFYAEFVHPNLPTWPETETAVSGAARSGDGQLRGAGEGTEAKSRPKSCPTPTALNGRLVTTRRSARAL